MQSLIVIGPAARKQIPRGTFRSILRHERALIDTRLGGSRRLSRRGQPRSTPARLCTGCSTLCPRFYEAGRHCHVLVVNGEIAIDSPPERHM
jgi:hypothetical protein